MSRPIWVSLTETFTSAPLAAIRSSIAEVLIAGGHRLGLGVTLSPRRSSDAVMPAPAQLPGRLDPLVDRLARHEPGGESPGEAVPAHEIEDALPLGEPEQALSHDHDGTLSKAGQAAAAARKTAPKLAGGGSGV